MRKLPSYLVIFTSCVILSPATNGYALPKRRTEQAVDEKQLQNQLTNSPEGQRLADALQSPSELPPDKNLPVIEHQKADKPGILLMTGETVSVADPYKGLSGTEKQFFDRASEGMLRFFTAPVEFKDCPSDQAGEPLSLPSTPHPTVLVFVREGVLTEKQYETKAPLMRIYTVSREKGGEPTITANMFEVPCLPYVIVIENGVVHRQGGGLALEKILGTTH